MWHNHIQGCPLDYRISCFHYFPELQATSAPRDNQRWIHGRWIFSFLRSLHAVFCSSLKSLHFPLAWYTASFYSHFPFMFLMTAIQPRVRQNLNTILICISLMADEVDHFISISSVTVWEVSVHLICPFIDWVFCASVSYIITEYSQVNLLQGYSYKKYWL